MKETSAFVAGLAAAKDTSDVGSDTLVRSARSRYNKTEKERKIGHRRVGEGGEITYKKIQTSQIMGSIQLGIQHTVSNINFNWPQFRHQPIIFFARNSLTHYFFGLFLSIWEEKQNNCLSAKSFGKIARKIFHHCNFSII